MRLQYYKTNKGIFLKDPAISYPRNETNLIKRDDTRLNGREFEYVYRSGFFFLEGIHEITSYEILVQGKNTLTGYRLKNSVPDELRKSLKEFYTTEEMPREWDIDADDYVFLNTEFESSLQHLYEDVYEKTESYWESADIEHKVLGELTLENFTIPERIEVKLCNKAHDYKIDTVDLSSIVTYDDLTKMVLPEFCLHTQPCSLSREQVYRIIRAYIKDNIDPKVARITSDYDFCFSVSKRVKIKPYVNKYEITKSNGKSYRSPRFQQNTVEEKLQIIFKAAPKVYQDYPVIEPWKADNLQDLQDQMKFYLETLMAEINSEVSECPHCNGTGHMVKKIGTNDRLTDTQ
jgi:hypothetical protein